MSEEKKTSSFAVKLLKPHTHAKKAYGKDEVIAADALDQVTADWLIEKKIGEKVAAASTPAAAAAKKNQE